MAASNPSPSRITAPMWRLWVDRPVTGWRLGGIYANKRGYHNTVTANLKSWPSNYSVRFALDTKRGPKDKARGIDYTMSDADMRKYTKRLIDAADRNDPRMRGVREFYGTVNSRTVVGRIRDNDTGSYRASSADSSHLWHIHVSVWTAYCDDWAILSGIVSVLKGESLSAWTGGGGSVPEHNSAPSPTLRAGDSGPRVEQLQRALNTALGAGLAVDGDYGPKTIAGVKLLQRRAGITQDGIFGPASERALRTLLEDDMDLTDKIKLTSWAQNQYKLKEIPVSAALGEGWIYSRAASDRAGALLVEQAKHTALLGQIAAGQSGLSEESIAAAIREGVKAALPSAAEMAREIGAELDGALDEAAAERAFEAVLRRVLTGLDEAGE